MPLSEILTQNGGLRAAHGHDAEKAYNNWAANILPILKQK